MKSNYKIAGLLGGFFILSLCFCLLIQVWTGQMAPEPAQPDCQGKSGLQGISVSYQPDVKYFCGQSGKMYSPTSNVVFTWDDAVSYCDNLELWGYTDWRLPDMSELRNDFGVSACSCVNWTNCGTIPTNCYGQSSCDLRTTCGSWDPSAAADIYWSSTESSTYVYYVSFSNANVRANSKTSSVYVRCGRG